MKHYINKDFQEWHQSQRTIEEVTLYICDFLTIALKKIVVSLPTLSTYQSTNSVCQKEKFVEIAGRISKMGDINYYELRQN